MNYSHMNTRRIAAFIVGAIASLDSVAHAQNLLTNPSFDLGSFVNRGDGFQILPNGSTAISGWTVINDELAWGTIPNSALIAPLSGLFFLDLQGDGVASAPYGGVTQSITTVAGQQYHLSFNLGTQQDTHPGPVAVSATAGGTTLPFSFNPGGTGSQWGEFGFDFTASSTSTAISIVGTQPSTTAAYIGLDQVSVIVVPGPSSAGLFATGAIIVAIRRRHRATNG